MITPVTLTTAYSRRFFAEDVGRRRGERLRVVVEGKAVYVAEVARLADAQDHGLEESIEARDHLLRRYRRNSKRPTACLTGSNSRVLLSLVAAVSGHD